MVKWHTKMAAKKSWIKLILIILAKGEKKSLLSCSSYKLSSAKFRGKNNEYLIWCQTGIKIIKNSKKNPKLSRGLFDTWI